MVTHFEKYADIYGGGVTAETIRSAVDDPIAHADTLKTVAGDLEQDSTVANGQVTGTPSPIAKNPAEAGANLTSLSQNGYYAVGVLNRFASKVETFDATVDGLNGQIDAEPADKREEKKKKLQGKWNGAFGTLEQGAEDTGAEFQNPPSKENIRKLIREGYLPLSAADAWDGLKLTEDDKKQFYKHALGGGALPDFDAMTTEEVQAYFKDNPEIAENFAIIMANAPKTEEAKNDVTAVAKAQAEILNKSIKDGDTDSEDFKLANTVLAGINKQIAEGGKIGPNQAAYIETWLNTLGADNLAKLPEIAKGAIPPGMPSYAAQATYQGYLSPVADAILNYSDPDNHTDDSPAADRDQYGAWVDMPDAIDDLLSTRIGHYENGMRWGEDGQIPGFSSVEGLDKLNGWADLMSASSEDVEGGHDFSMDLADQALQAKQDMNSIMANAGRVTSWVTLDEAGWQDLDAKLSDYGASNLLSVASRNEDAMADFVTSDVAGKDGVYPLSDEGKALLGMNWSDDQGASDVVRSAIDRDPADGGGNPAQADAALALMLEIARDPQFYEDNTTEGVSDAVVDTAITWRDAFVGNPGTQTGNDTDVGVPDLLGNKRDLLVTMSADDQAQFLHFIAGSGDPGEGGKLDETDPLRFQSAVRSYTNGLIDGALETGDPTLITQAISHAGAADAQIKSATINWAMDQEEYKHDTEIAKVIAENRETAALNTAAKITTSLAGTGAGLAFPPAAPFISVGNAFVGPIIDGVLDQQKVPDYTKLEHETAADFMNDAELDVPHKRNLMLATLADPSLAKDPQYAGLYNSDGTLKTMGEIQNYSGPDGVGTDLLDKLARKVVPAGTDLGAYNDAWQATSGVEYHDDDRNGVSSDADGRRKALYGDNVPDGYDPEKDQGGEDNNERTTYPTDKKHIEDNVWDDIN